MAKRTLLLLGALGLLVGLLWPVLTGSGSPTQAASEQSPASSVAASPSQEVEPSPTVARSTVRPKSDTPLIHAVKPTGMRIPGVTPKSGASVIAQPQYYGRNPQTGKSNVLMYDTPNNLDDVSWWSADPAGNPAPKPGSDPERNKYIAVFWGHTALNDKDGVFARLGTVKLGDKGYIEGTDSKGVHGVLTMRALKTYQVPKDPQTAFDRSLDKAPVGTQVATGTCSGDVDWATGHHQDMRIVLWEVVMWTPAA